MPNGFLFAGVVVVTYPEIFSDLFSYASLPTNGRLMLNRNGTTSANAIVRVTDSTVCDNGVNGVLHQDGARATVTRVTVSGNTGFGVLVLGNGTSTTTTADVADSTIDGNNSNGVQAWSQNATAVVNVSVHDSRVVRNIFGVQAESNAGAFVTLSVSNNIISNNSNAGIRAVSAGSKAWVSGNTVSDNVTGLWNNSGLLESAGNNAVRNNGTDTSGLITGVATM